MRRERPERAASSQPRATPWAPNLLGFQPVQGRPYVPNCEEIRLIRTCGASAPEGGSYLG